MPEPTDFHTDADVFSSDGHKLGTLKGVVLKRKDLEVTKIIVDIGFLRSGHHLWEGGLGLDYDRVVPVEVVRATTEKRVDLAWSAGRFKDAPEYTEESFEAPRDLSPNEFDLTDVVDRARSLGFLGLATGTPSIWLTEKQNRTKDEVDIEEGAAVWRVEPHEKLGEVDRVLVDESSGRAVALVVRRGVLLKRDVILPVRYLTEVLDDVIHVEIGEEELDRLQEFRAT